MKKILLGFIGILIITGCEKQKGCTEPNAINYDSVAEENDGSCRYDEVVTETSSDDGSTDSNSGDESTDTESEVVIEIGALAHGGIIAYIDDTGEHGLVCSVYDLGAFAWEDAKNASYKYVSTSGHDDWYLPSKDELNLLYLNLKKNGLGEFAYTFYWSSQGDGTTHAWMQNFSNGGQGEQNRTTLANVRAVRAF